MKKNEVDVESLTRSIGNILMNKEVYTFYYNYDLKKGLVDKKALIPIFDSVFLMINDLIECPTHTHLNSIGYLLLKKSGLNTGFKDFW